MITPIKPDYKGSGRAKRAHLWLATLQKEYDTEVLIIQNGRSASFFKCGYNEYVLNIKNSFSQKARQVINILISLLNGRLSGLSRLFWFSLTKEQELYLSHFRGIRYSRVICFRLYLSEQALYLNSIADIEKTELDMDDLESSTWKSIARLLVRERKFKAALHFWMASLQFFRNESLVLDKFSSLYVCSEDDREILSARFNSSRFEVFANKIYGYPLSRNQNNPPVSFLFIGSMDYYPNASGISWFIKCVWPLLLRKYSFIRLNIAGFATTGEITRLVADTEGANLLEPGIPIEEIYKSSDIVISPLFAGGGTKLKILEAMWFGLPVVATEESVRGFRMVEEVHYLAADLPVDFIKKCETLLLNKELYQKLSANGQQLVARNFCY